jgi:hypothetical protein
MPHATIRLKPGVETNNTFSLNEAAYSQSQLIRYLPERNGLGLAQKLGGWVNYFNLSIGSKIRALKGWADLNAINHLGIGAESALNVLTGNNLVNITPQISTTNTAPNFTTTSGSTTVTVVDANITASVLDFVNYVTPVSVGGIILSGPYQLYTAAGTTYTIIASSPATATVTSGGASYAFSTTNGSSIVSGTFNGHGFAVGDTFYVGVATTVGGVTLSGLYTILTAPTVNTFTFSTQNSASSTAGPVSINSGNINANFYIAIGPQPTSTGFGVGGFGVGGFGVGSAQPFVPGTPITATDWTLDNFGQNLIACPAGSAIYYWQPNGQLQNAQIIGGNGPLVNSGIFVAMPERQVIAYGSSFNLAPDPLLIRWSDIEDYTVWNATPTNQAGSYRIPTGSKIVAGIQGPQQGLIWTDLDLWAMQYIGAPLVYGFNKIGSNCGAVSRHCIGQMNGGIYWMSQKQFFMSMGSGPQAIPCPIWDVIFQNINTSYLNKVCCGVNSQFNEVTWYYPSASSTENDSYVKYNVALAQWDYGTLGRTAWIDQSVLGSPIGAGSDNWLYQHEVGNDAVYNGQTTGMQSSFSTGYFSLNEADNLVFVDQIWPDMKWGTYSGNTNATVYLTINYTNYATDAATSPSTSYYSGSPSGQITSVTFPMTQSTEYISCRIRARFMSFSLSSTDTGTFWRLGGIRYRYQMDGRF